MINCCRMRSLRLFNKNKYPKLSKKSQFLIIICITVAFFLVWNSVCPGYMCLRYRGTKYILFWDDLYLKDDSFPFDGIGYDLFKGCRYSNCFVSIDTAVYPVERFDAIVFHGELYSDQDYPIPASRRPEQRYIYYNQKAPLAYRRKNDKKLERYKDFFNWTMTYRRDSDIPVPFAKIRAKEYDPQSIVPQAGTWNSMKLAAWLPSNCNPSQEPDHYVAVLQEYFPVDIYGECGTLSCTPGAKIGSEDCDSVLREYKFVLAFEKAICVDHTSDELWRTLSHYPASIPVVRGGSNLADVLPPGSFIDATKFKHPAELAKYLIYVSTHEDEFLNYFRWRRFFEVERVWLPCEMCRKLQEDSAGAPQIYRNVDNWWRVAKDGGSTCKRLWRFLRHVWGRVFT